MSLHFSQSFGYTPSFTKSLLSTNVETSYVSVKVYPLFYSKIIVEWSIPAAWGSCLFNVYKGDTESGPWLNITPAPISNSNFIEDTDTQDFSKFHKSYYIVEALLPTASGRYIRSLPSTWENKRSSFIEVRASEITRREKVLLTKFSGVDALVFRRKRFGARCPNCYNKDTEKVTKDNCQVCLGTSFVGGYFPGVLTRINFDPANTTTQATYLGKLESNQIAAWTTNLPEVMNHDMILRLPDFKIFRVENVAFTELQTLRVRQLLQLIEKDKASIEMSLLKNIIPSKYLLPAMSGNTTTTTTGYII